MEAFSISDKVRADGPSRRTKDRLLDAAIRGSRTIARARRGIGADGRALVVPPAGEGSLGDAAMLNATLASLRSLGMREVDLLLRPGWGALGAFDRQIDADDYFYGGWRRRFLPVLASLGRYSHAYFVGADVVDGVYNPGSVQRRLDVLAEVVAIGGRATVLGSSFSEAPDPVCVAALRALPDRVRIKARDPVSRMRMEAALDRPIELVADLAFLLAPDRAAPSAAKAIEWIGLRRQAGDRIVALNANYLIDVKHPGFSARLGPLMERLLARDISLLLVPHDTRTDRSDRHILMEALATAGPSAEGRVLLLEPEAPGMIKAVLGAVDLVVTGRMHVAILAMGAGRPALSFGYQGKFEGLYQLLGLGGTELLLSPRLLVEQFDRVVEAVQSRLDAAAWVAADIAAGLPAVRQLALANFADA